MAEGNLSLPPQFLNLVYNERELAGPHGEWELVPFATIP